MDRSTLGLPVHHQLLELAQTHVCRVSDAIQPSHPLLSTFPPAFNLLLPSILPGIRVLLMSRLFTSDGQNIGAPASASILPMNIQGGFPLGLTGVNPGLASY